MPQRKHKPEEIVAKLRQVDVLLSQGRPVAEAIRTIGVTPFTYYRWRKEFGGRISRVGVRSLRLGMSAIITTMAKTTMISSGSTALKFRSMLLSQCLGNKEIG